MKNVSVSEDAHQRIGKLQTRILRERLEDPEVEIVIGPTQGKVVILGIAALEDHYNEIDRRQRGD